MKLVWIINFIKLKHLIIIAMIVIASSETDGPIDITELPYQPLSRLSS